VLEEVLERGKLTDPATLDRLTTDDLVPVVQDLLHERGLRNVEYGPLTFDLPLGASVDSITCTHLNATTLRITVPKGGRRRRAAAGGYGYPSSHPAARRRAIPRGYHTDHGFAMPDRPYYGHRGGMAPAWVGPSVGYGGAW